MSTSASDHHRAALRADAADTERPAPDPKAWAWRLKARHESGADLTDAQIHAYQAVTGAPSVPTQADAWE